MTEGGGGNAEGGGRLFTEMPELSQATLEVLESLGFRSATPVQEATIPLFCGNKVGRQEPGCWAPALHTLLQPPAEVRRRLHGNPSARCMAAPSTAE